MKDSYVYVYLDPRKPGKYSYEGLEMSFLFEPFYIGEGKKNRLYIHLHPAQEKVNAYKYRKIKCIFDLELEPIILKYKILLTKQEALDLEYELVKTIGKAFDKTGPLTNLKDGGGNAKWFINHGKTESQLNSAKSSLHEHNRKMKEDSEYKAKVLEKKDLSIIRRFGKKFPDAWNKGKKLSSTHLENLKKSLSAKKDKMGEENYNLYLKEKNKHHKGTVWINDGLVQKKIKESELLSYKNWFKGRIKKNIKTVWITNLELKLNKRLEESLINTYLEDGWKIGKIHYKKHE